MVSWWMGIHLDTNSYKVKKQGPLQQYCKVFDRSGNFVRNGNLDGDEWRSPQSSLRMPKATVELADLSNANIEVEEELIPGTCYLDWAPGCQGDRNISNMSWVLKTSMLW